MKIELPQFPDSSQLTHSAVKCWNSCRRRFLFAYLMGIRRTSQSEPLRIGSMWHLGVELYEGGTDIESAIEAIRNAYLDSDCPKYLEPEEFKVEEEKVCAMVRAHHQRYKDDRIITTIAVEKRFSVPIVNPETGYPTPSYTSDGKIDRIGQLPDGTIAIVERKTTSEQIDATSNYWLALRNDPQISRYFIAAKAMGYDATKIVYDVVRKPMIRPKNVTKAEQAQAVSKGDYYGLALHGPCPERETPEMYGHRLYVDMIGRPEFYFARNEIARTDNDLEEFKQDLWDVQKDISNAINNQRFYRNPASCLEPFTCEYLDVCGELYTIPKELPEGFRRVEVIHEELIERIMP